MLKISLESTKRCKNFKDLSLLARQALKKCLPSYDIENELINYHELPDFPQNLVSLSHTSCDCLSVGGAFLSSKKSCLSLGLDLEFEDRVISEKAFRFFSSPYDATTLPPLHLWAFKEAALKTLNLLVSKRQGPFVLKDIWATEKNFGLWDSTYPLGSVQLKKVSMENKTLIVALAWVGEIQEEITLL